MMSHINLNAPNAYLRPIALWLNATHHGTALFTHPFNLSFYLQPTTEK